MQIIFRGFRHSHIEGLYDRIKSGKKLQIAACVEDDEATKKEIAARKGIVFDEKGYDYWLEKDIDIVAIGGCYGDRGRDIIKALEAGKHVIADKPICTDLEELKEIRRLSVEKNLKVACMLDLRYRPAVKAAAQLYKSGELGEAVNVSFNGQHCLDFEHRPKWYFEKGKHGGTINDLAIHAVDLIRYITGQNFIKTLFAETRNKFAEKSKDFKDCAIFTAELEHGGRVQGDVSYSAPASVYSTPIYWDFKFWCTEGMMNFCWNKSETVVCKKGNVYDIPGIDDGIDYIDVFLEEIKTDKRDFTESVLDSSEQTLKIQYAADKLKI